MAYSNNQAARPAAPAMGRPVILGAPAVDSGAPPEVSEPAWLVTLARVDETPDARLLAPDSRAELMPEAPEARDSVADSRAEEAELAALSRALLALSRAPLALDARLDASLARLDDTPDASLARLDVTLDASLARLEVTLDASLARLEVTLPALSVAEAKADDKTPRAPEEMAVADALAD